MKFEFFTNQEETEAGKVDVKAPAFSLTKVQTSLAALLTAIAGVLPPALGASTPIWIAVIAAGTLIMLGGFGLAAVDLVTRQRAREATLRYAGGGGSKGYLALPENKKLVVQADHSGLEYEVEVLRVDADQATLVATRNGETMRSVFHDPEKTK